jgi:hypothetical protein
MIPAISSTTAPVLSMFDTSFFDTHQKIFPCVSKNDTSNIENAGGVVELIAGVPFK